MNRRAVRGASGAAVLAIAAAIGLIAWRDESIDAPTASMGTSLAKGIASPASEVSRETPSERLAMPTASTAVAAVIEYSANWPEWLHFETDDERSARHLRSDPFVAVDNLRDLLARASRGDSEAALRLHDLAEYCDDHREAPEMPPEYLRLDCSVPRSWSADQRRGWRRQAVLSGDRSPPMSMLKEAEFMRPDDPLLAETVSDAALSLDYAARRGCLECLLALATVYQEGRLAQQDLRKSFAYLQVAAAASGERFYAESAEKIRPSLRPIDIEFARSLQERLAKALEKHKAR